MRFDETAEEARFRHIGGGPKGLFLLLRYVFIISASYLVVSYRTGEIPAASALMIAVALASNVGLGLLEPERLFSWYVEAPVLVADTWWVSWSLHSIGVSGQEFFLLYFFVLFLAAIGESLTMVLLGTTAVSAANAYFMAPDVGLGPRLLHIVFFFTVALFYGHVITQMRRERARANRGFAWAHELEERVAERTAQLRRLYETAVAANRLKSELVASMSHELRTPLNVIMGYSQMLRDPHHGLRSEALGLNRRIHEVAEQLLDLVNGLLDLGQLEAGKAPVSTEPLPLDHFLNDLRARERMPLNSAVRLVWDVPAELPVIESDSEKLSVVVENLIGNACKFTLKGTVTVTVRDFARERWIELSVADTGPGIAEADLSRIFEPFCQVQEPPMRGKTGYGLGLAIVRRQLELLGGEMRVESRLEHGSTFTIRLPYSPPPASAASPDHLGSVDPAEPTSVRLPSAA
jgi:signal transduction histidine kinase